MRQPTRAIVADAGIGIGHPAFENSTRIGRHRRERGEGIRADARDRVRPREMVGDVPAIGGQMHRAAEQQLAAGQGRAPRDGAGFQVDDILVAPRDVVALVHDVEADRQAFGRELAVDVAVGAVEHHLAFAELAAPGEAEVQRFAEAAVDGFRVVIIIVADIAGAEIARGQEAEIMVVRDAVGEGGGAARGGAGIGRGGPEGGAEIKAARAAVE